MLSHSRLGMNALIRDLSYPPRSPPARKHLLTMLFSNHLIDTKPIPLDILEIHPLAMITRRLLATAARTPQLLDSLLGLFELASLSFSRELRKREHDPEHTSSML